ncbi:hypothetical protein LVD15_20025 [Fulvivirga maritima]|uniref:hypothetical protein n=1 Tax=Fulvivirga maritima TaxID=2904247 RepID=UPI001F188A97|nr:hypothetical protein [Fulvivirga maritima]UII25573.1 hypothetical protein LVD15_20025 [Fulvivirga maritima]
MGRKCEYYDEIKKTIIKDLETWAPNKPLLDGICDSWAGYPLIYDRSLVSYKGMEPIYDTWENEIDMHAFVYAHLYKHGNKPLLIAQSYLGFKEFEI